MNNAPKPSKQKRRDRGSGAVFQRTRTLKDGRKVKYWTTSIRLDDGTRREFQAKTKTAVLAKLAEWQGRLSEGKPLETNVTMTQFMDRFLTQHIRPRVRPLTYDAYERIVTHHILPELGRLKLGDVKPERVQGFINAKSDEGLGPQTVRNIRTLLKQAMTVAIGWELVDRNPVVFTSPPRVTKVKRARLTGEEAKRLFDACQHHRLGALYQMALVLGVRLSQLLGLRWQDIDWDKSTVRLETSLSRVHGKWELTEPKTEASAHTLPLPPQLVTVLRAHQDQQAFERKKMGDDWRDTWGLVFTREDGSPMHGVTVLKMLQGRLLPAANLPPMRFHDLRGSCATLLAVLGVHPRTAMEILGHSDIRTTLAFYTSASSDAQLDAMMKLAGHIWGTETSDQA